MTFREAVAQRVLVFDGAMGTQIQGHQLKAPEFGGKEGANDLLVLTRPDLIEDIHARYYAAGCDVVETNTFGSSRLKRDEYGLGHRTYEVNFKAAITARRAAERFQGDGRPRFVAGSIGPTGMLPSSSDPALGNITSDALERIFFEQAKGLIEGGVDAIVVETQQDMLELRAAVLAADACRRECLRDVFLIAQPTLIDANGRMLLGTDVGSALATLERLPVDAVGLNCSTGPDEMRASVKYLAERCSHYVSVLPNAGMPENVDGRAVYKLSPEALAEALAGFVRDYGVDIVGGCCGTTPDHLKAVVERIRALEAAGTPRRKRPAPAAELSSAMKAVPLAMEPRPLVVGERLNAQGSRKVKELLLQDDYPGLLQIARGQVEAGAHVLDVCVALNERDDEAAQMRTLAKLLAQSVDAPLMIDSTEADVVEGALKVYAGRCIVNSVNLEKSGERVKKVLPLVKRYGAAVVAMTIDEKGMAQTADRKAEIARRMVQVAAEYGIPPDALVFDALTFTLATGGAEYRHSAVETLDGIRRIKAENPGVLTVLGVSNVSFGLAKSAREVVNSVFLYHAVQAGLDLAIVNPKDIRAYPQIAEEERTLAEDLVYDRRDDALARLIAHFGEKGAEKAIPAEDLLAGKSVEERIHLQILHRRPEGIEALIDDALRRRSAVAVLNEILLPAMKDVGDRFGAGELILPFVLQSAEVMKKAVAHLEKFLEKKEGTTKGTVVLATVYGDVHDIGKNLVKTILTNNGFTVHDLGKQVPVATVIEKAASVNADAIGLSALLVSTSKQMPFCVEELHRRNLTFPVLIGGAAINRRFGYRAHFTQDGTPYAGGVFYAKDAFEGLDIVEALVDPPKRDALKHQVLQKAIAAKNVPADAPLPPAPARRSDVRAAPRIPVAPFWGPRVVPAGQIALADLWPHLDLDELYKLQWGVKAKGAEYERMIREEFGPKLEELKAEAQANGWLVPKVVYGYFPCHAEGNDLVVLDPVHRKAEVARLRLPRQPDDRNLCLADWFREERGSDVCSFQVVTVGDQASKLAEAAQERGDYSRGLFVHGLAVEAAEALAEYWHRQVRRELGIPEGVGKRYSPGYPSWPDLGDQRQVWKLLEPERAIGVSLTEANQMVPEQSTSAIVLHHPDAIYFLVRGAERAA
ncbi:MAG TPA: methionine synthase [Anaeromyxobacter sp.]|nr:methionine synthase [Anaeromyxobacter sp.]